jgi:hypothetical protein
MKKLVNVAFVLILFFGCKKDDEKATPEPAKKFSDKIVLNEVKVTGNEVTLSWSELDVTDFVSYSITRSQLDATPMYGLNIINNIEQTSYIDKNVPYSTTVRYQIIGTLKSGKNITSNTVTYNRPQIKVYAINPYDIIYSKNDQLLYLIEKNGIVSIYDIAQGTISKSINTSATLGYGDIGTFNGKKELYIPRTDGWVFVYDAITLEKIAQLSTGLNNSSVVYHNNNLYVSTSAWTRQPLKVISRTTGLKIAETGDFDLTRIRRVPNTDLELVEISMYIAPTDQDRYRFSTNGVVQNHWNDIYHGDHVLDADIFDFFPDGSRYITSGNGAIYNKDMTYITTLPRGNLFFSSYAFSESENQIYATSQTTPSIEVFSMNSYNHIKSIATPSNPYKVFDLGGNQLLCVSSVNQRIAGPCNSCIKDIIIEKVSK